MSMTEEEQIAQMKDWWQRNGKPLLTGASVQATIVSHGRGEKVRIFKMRRRKHY